jgi:hypothetical protein
MAELCAPARRRGGPCRFGTRHASVPTSEPTGYSWLSRRDRPGGDALPLRDQINGVDGVIGRAGERVPPLQRRKAAD